jgi:hypothetical protein
MLRSFMVSTIAFTCPVPSATLLVCDAVPLVSSVIEVVEVVVEARSWQLLNCRNASMSKYLRASSFSVLSRIDTTSCLARSESLPVYGTLLPASRMVSVFWATVKPVSGIGSVSERRPPWLETFE